MPTPNLLKIYRQSESESRALYEQLYQSPLTHKIGIELRHLNASRSFPCFYYYTEEIMQVTSAIMTELRTLTAITSALPLVAIESFRRVCLIEEIQSTNAIEGVRSTRLEDIARTVGQSTRTVRNHISSYPSEHITINRSHRAHRFKLSRTFIEKLQSSISN